MSATTAPPTKIKKNKIGRHKTVEEQVRTGEQQIKEDTQQFTTG